MTKQEIIKGLLSELSRMQFKHTQMYTLRRYFESIHLIPLETNEDFDLMAKTLDRYSGVSYLKHRDDELTFKNARQYLIDFLKQHA